LHHKKLFLKAIKMARVMAIDYGTKRVGVAVTDPLQLIANPLDTVHSKDIVDYIVDYNARNPLETLVIGLPKHLDGSINEVEKHIKLFIKKFEAKLPHINISRIDERFTSKMAFQTMIDGGLKKQQRANKETIDMVSATIILQSYLLTKQNGF
jgi:putative Holliday junction resolvase